MTVEGGVTAQSRRRGAVDDNLVHTALLEGVVANLGDGARQEYRAMVRLIVVEGDIEPVVEAIIAYLRHRVVLTLPCHRLGNHDIIRYLPIVVVPRAVGNHLGHEAVLVENVGNAILYAVVPDGPRMLRQQSRQETRHNHITVNSVHNI